MSKKVTVKCPGNTDNYTNAVIGVDGNGNLVVETSGRSAKRVVYATGRWSQATEEGLSDA